MTKHTITFLLCLAGLLFTSCYPYVMPAQQSTGTIQQRPATTTTNRTTTKSTYRPKVANPNQTVSSAAQKELRRQEQAQPSYQQTTPNILAPVAPVVKSYPIAIPIPGKPGWVYNPYNNNPVVIQGIPSGKTVLDPQDPNKDHKFKVP